MPLVPTVNIAYKEPEDYPQATRLIGSNSEQLRIPNLPISLTAGEKNMRGERLIKKIRARQASILERKAKRERKRRRRRPRIATAGCATHGRPVPPPGKITSSRWVTTRRRKGSIILLRTVRSAGSDSCLGCSLNRS